MESLVDLSAPERSIVWGVPAALIVFGAIQLEGSLRGRVSRFFAYLGDASYSTYLIHVFALAAFSAILWWPLATIAAIGVGVIQYRYVEQPLLRLLKKRPAAMRAELAAAA
jgi:peptidoglycan/LPS O-acetylase OafA/YrhL